MRPARAASRCRFAMPPLVEFRDVSYSVNGRPILRGINLRVSPGETLVLLGRSGSGKTTLLKTVNRLVEPDSGVVTFEGEPVSQWDAIRLRRRIGYVIQEGGLFPHRTVEQNVGLVPRLDGWDEGRVRERVAELLETVGLAPERYAARFPRELSGGERQRVGIARALAARPPLLLMDEPFAALDPVTRFELQQQFLELGQTGIFVTHDVREALRIGSRIALLREGRVLMTATPGEFASSGVPEARAFLASLEQEWRPT
jgi:osmoprotectant transport system ATP-binding protein